MTSCRWCGDPIGPRATYCSARCRVYANRVDRDAARGVFRACVYFGPGMTYRRIEAVRGDGIGTWIVVRPRFAAVAGG